MQRRTRERTGAENPGQVLCPVRGGITRRLQVTLACASQHTFKSGMSHQEIGHAQRVHDSGALCNRSNGSMFMPDKWCNGRGSVLVELCAPKVLRMNSRMPHDSLMVTLSWSVSTGILQGRCDILRIHAAVKKNEPYGRTSSSGACERRVCARTSTEGSSSYTRGSSGSPARFKGFYRHFTACCDGERLL